MQSVVGHKWKGKPNKGLLTVVNISKHRSNGGARLYEVNCSICSKDLELFTEGNFLMTKAQIKNDGCPCGCSKHRNWSKKQYQVRVERARKEKDIEFIGFYGDWSGNKTKLKLRCNIDGHIWSSGSIDRILIGKGCPECGTLKLKEDEMIRNIRNTRHFSKEHKFYPIIEGAHTYLGMYCPICSQDEYVKGGVCSGVFTSTYSSLKLGFKPCRCSNSYRWSKAQRELQIGLICNKERLKFTSWSTDKLDYNSKFKWVCQEGAYM